MNFVYFYSSLLKGFIAGRLGEDDDDDDDDDDDEAIVLLKPSFPGKIFIVCELTAAAVVVAAFVELGRRSEEEAVCEKALDNPLFISRLEEISFFLPID